MRDAPPYEGVCPVFCLCAVWGRGDMRHVLFYYLCSLKQG